MFPSIVKDVICKLGDKLIFLHPFSTGEDPELRIYKENTIIATINPSYTDDLGHIFELEIDSNFDASTSYNIIIKDFFFSEPIELDEYYSLYVNNDVEMENNIIRSLGLAGHNVRYYDHVWQNGQLTQFKIKFYSTKIALELADAGGTDNFLASYTVSIFYDSNYNPYEIRSVRTD